MTFTLDAIETEDDMETDNPKRMATLSMVTLR